MTGQDIPPVVQEFMAKIAEDAYTTSPEEIITFIDTELAGENASGRTNCATLIAGTTFFGGILGGGVGFIAGSFIAPGPGSVAGGWTGGQVGAVLGRLLGAGAGLIGGKVFCDAIDQRFRNNDPYSIASSSLLSGLSYSDLLVRNVAIRPRNSTSTTLYRLF